MRILGISVGERDPWRTSPSYIRPSGCELLWLWLVLEYYVEVEERGGILGVGVRISGNWAGMGEGD